ncbi:MAG: glycosyltransferase [Oligoflexia bacterium]|nr:glycosyltransferase [Oligoflexia bacterium]
MDLRNKLILEAGHVTEVYGPVQALRNYLIKKAYGFILITHPFSYSGLAGTEASYYEDGKVVHTEHGHKRGKNQLIQWVKDVFFNISYLFRCGKIDLFIGVDNLNAATGIIMKAFGKVDKVAYYIIDHMDRRFKNPVFNWFYELIDGFACRGSDVIWSLSSRIAEAKNKKFRLNPGKNIVVPVGVELDKVDKFSVEEKIAKKTLVLMSMLDETKGVQLLIEAMQDVIKEVPEAQLLVIGTGPYEQALKDQAKKLSLENSVKFLGLMDHEQLFKFIPHERVSVAPYMDDPNNYTYYADPTKPKEYLGCGLPMVITDVPWIAEEVKKRPMGVVCRYRREELAAACVKLLKDDEFYKACLNNALDFASRLSWESIYGEAFRSTLRQ